MRRADRTVFAGGDVVGESSPIKEEEATVGGLTAPGEHAGTRHAGGGVVIKE